MSDEPQTSLPTTKVARAARFAKTGFTVGTNYIKHYAKKAVGAESTTEALHAANMGELTLQSMLFEPARKRIHAAFGRGPTSAISPTALDVETLLSD